MSAESAIRISVALVTRNRPHALRRCLASLRGQSVQPFEVVVADDSDDEIAETTRAVAEEFGCRYLRGPRRGLYANRNAAALACAGTHIRTMDDDHTFPPGHFAQCLAAVQTDPAAVWTTGEIGFLDEQPHAFTPTATQLGAAGVGTPVTDPLDNWAVADGSTIFPAEVFARGLRMVERFGFGSGYLEFGALLYRCGWHSRCVPDAVVEHHYSVETLRRAAPESCLFASLCFNLYFRRNLGRAARYLVAWTLPGRRARVAFSSVATLLALARQRWNC